MDHYSTSERGDEEEEEVCMSKRGVASFHPTHIRRGKASSCIISVAVCLFPPLLVIVNLSSDTKSRSGQSRPGGTLNPQLKENVLCGSLLLPGAPCMTE